MQNNLITLEYSNEIITRLINLGFFASMAMHLYRNTTSEVTIFSMLTLLVKIIESRNYTSD